jgi:hypothetical protein
MGSTDRAKVLEVLASRALAARSNIVLRPPILVPICWMATGIVRRADFPESPDFIECGGRVTISRVLSSSSISFRLPEAVDDGALTWTDSREGCCAALNGGRLSGVRGVARWLPEIELGNLTIERISKVHHMDLIKGKGGDCAARRRRRNDGRWCHNGGEVRVVVT